jgi:hypothetical protein
MRREKTKLYEGRVSRFLSRLEGGLAFAERVPLAATYSRTEDPVPFAGRLDGKFGEITQGQSWGQTSFQVHYGPSKMSKKTLGRSRRGLYTVVAPTVAGFGFASTPREGQQ